MKTAISKRFKTKQAGKLLSTEDYNEKEQ